MLFLPIDCNPRCQNGGFCVDDVCSCPDGYNGPTCEESTQYELRIRTSDIPPSIGGLVQYLCTTNNGNVANPPRWYDTTGRLIPLEGDGECLLNDVKTR